MHVPAEQFPTPDRKVINIAELEDLGNIELRYGSIQFAVVRVLHDVIQCSAEPGQAAAANRRVVDRFLIGVGGQELQAIGKPLFNPQLK